MDMILLTYILTFILPLNGLVLIGMINERKKNKRLLMALWKMGNKHGRY